MYRHSSKCVSIQVNQPFERPLHARFRRQWANDRPDPEVGDDDFDAMVYIETDDYEALFDVMQHLGRRQLVYEFTRGVDLMINVDEVEFTETPAPMARLNNPEAWLLVLAWSLVHEKAPHL